MDLEDIAAQRKFKAMNKAMKLALANYSTCLHHSLVWLTGIK